MRLRSLVLGSVLFASLLAGRADAQGFVSPYLATTFSKPVMEACSFSAGCQDGQSTFGVSVGALGRVVGFEFDLGYTKGFFGEAGDASSGLMTAFGNFMLAPKFGPVQPYGVGGVGLLRLHVDSLSSAFLENDENTVAWDLGAGLMVFFGDHVGVRADIRHFRAMQDLEVLSFTIEGSNVKFNRASAAVVFKF